MKEKRKKYNKTVLLAKAKLNTFEVLGSKALIHSYILIITNFFSVNNVLRECIKMKEEIENPENAVEYTI